MKPISCNQEMGDTERFLCPGTTWVLRGINRTNQNVLKGLEASKRYSGN